MSRTSRMILALLAAALLPTLAFSGNAASDPAAAIGAVAVAPDQSDLLICRNRGTSDNAIGLNLSYSGVKPLRAYAISVHFRDADSGQPRSKVSLYAGETIQDRSIWHVTVCDVGRNLDLATVRTETDMLAFLDGTCSGPIMLRQSQHLVGSLEASDYERGSNPKLAEVFATPTPNGDSENLIPINDSSLPVAIDVSIGQDSSDIPILIVGARNTGVVPILGLEFKISYFDHATGKFQRSVTTKAVPVVDGKLTPMAPGSRWLVGGRKIPVAADGALDGYIVTVDAVSLSDGSFLGARRSLEADELRGIIEGMQIAGTAQEAKL